MFKVFVDIISVIVELFSGFNVVVNVLLLKHYCEFNGVKEFSVDVVSVMIKLFSGFNVVVNVVLCKEGDFVVE
uniref:Candidate secreted effector n=1 Tax=Meloidogyne incognita TaxID=6306 RepID=A0A914N2C6_MELIC